MGGKIGTGKQWMSWVHLSDMIGIIDLCIDDPNLSGPLNCTSPYPQTNGAFTHALGAVLKRPTLIQIPAFLINLLLGKMGEELLLSGKHVVPVKLNNAGYQFKYEHLEDALGNIVNNS